MKRLTARIAAAALCLAPLLAAPQAARAQADQQELVDRATLTVQDLFRRIEGRVNDPLRLIRSARGVMVCPEVFRAAFFFGGAGGGCVLVGRDAAGNWSYPAFYAMGAGSFGFQAGIQDAEVLMLVMTNRGMAAVIDDQFKIGGDASLSLATLGTGIEGDTTGALGADILMVNKSRGLFASIALQGSIMSSSTGANQAYYGRPLAARQIVVEGQVRNPGAEPLRETLARYSAPAVAPVAAAYAPPPPGYPPPYGATPQPIAPGAPPPITARPLPPPR